MKIGGTGDWKRLFTELKAGEAPANTAFIRPVLGSGLATGTVYFDNVRLQEEGVTTRYTYNNSYTRMIQRTDALGNATKFDYDILGNEVVSTTPLGAETKTSYDALSRPTEVIPPSNDSKIVRKYDKDGQLLAIDQHLGVSSSEPYSTTSFTYHPSGQMKTSTDPLGRTRKYSYTPAGRVQQIQYPNGERVGHVYSPVGDLTNVIYNGVNRYSYGYDRNSNINSVYDSSVGTKWLITYDPNNQLKTWSDGKKTVEYNRDEAGNVTYQGIKIGSTVEKNQTIQYNLVNQPIALTDDNGGTSKFLYNEHSKLSMLQAGNQTTERRQYDSVGRVTQVLSQGRSGKTTTSFRYEYDADGNMTKVTDHIGQKLNFTYDANGRLLTETHPSGNIITYEYDRAEDPLGNRTKRIETHPDGTVLKTTTYKYDKANQMTSVDGTPWKYNERGYVVSNGKHDFEWDAAGRLVKVKKAGTTEVAATYEYDFQGRRVKQTIGGESTNFLYEGLSNRVAAEYDSQGIIKKYFVWGPGDRLLSFTTGNTTYYPSYNGHGDIVQLTDANGIEVTQYYQYDAWGNMNLQEGSTIQPIFFANPYRYAGYRYDDVIGLYYLNARYYDPMTGRFLSPDPEFETPEYGYAIDNPLVFSDPTGLRPMCECDGPQLLPYSELTAYWEDRINGSIVATGLFASEVVPHLRVAKYGGYSIKLASQSLKHVKVNRDLIIGSATTPKKGGETIVGHALQKHAGRKPEIWGKVKGGPEQINRTAVEHLEEIISGPGGFVKVKNERGITFLEKSLIDGRGVRLNMDGTFKGFIDK